MHTRPAAPHRRRPLAGALVLLTLTLAACSSAAGPSPSSPPEGGNPSPEPTPTAVPGDGSADPGDTTGGPGGGTGGGTDPGAGGGGSGGNPGTGILPPGIVFPVAPVPDEGLLGNAVYLTPTDGLLNPRNVNVQLVRAGVGADGHTYVDLRWYSGVAPCNMLDSVTVVRDDTAKTVRLTVVEGSGPGDAMCIEIAELHATAVDLGVLDAGKWTISAEGDAPAITLDVE
jgi:hypothetical protein